MTAANEPPRLPPGPVGALLRYRRVFRNYLSVARTGFFKSYPRRAVLKDGRVLELADEAQFFRALEYEERGWRYDSRADTLSIPFPPRTEPLVFVGAGHNGSFAAIYGGHEYDWLDVAGRAVVDVGSNVGDTATYFAARGALQVVGLEPFPFPYSLAIENVRRNSLADRVVLLRAACGGRDGEIGIDPDLRASTSTAASDGAGRAPTPVLSLATIAERYHVVDGVLKLNCEGGEYEIVEAATPGVLRRFHQIHVEYHYGLGDIIDRLRGAGFSAEFTEPRRMVGLGDQPRPMDLGYIRARRQTQP